MISIKTDEWCLDNIGAVIFDKDGTLIDSHLYWGRIIERRARAVIDEFLLLNECFNELCSIMGYSIKQKKLMPQGPIALVGREEVIDIVNEYLEKHNIKSDKEKISDIFVKEHKLFTEELFDYIELLPGVTNFLMQLRNKNIKTAIVTSDSVHNTELILKYLKIDSLFDVIIGKESTIKSKITGIPVLKALISLNDEPQNSICIGDAPVDIIMALKSGCKAGIGLTTGQVLKEELIKHSSYVTSSFEKIIIN